MALTIPDNLFDYYNEACDALLNSSKIAKSCTLIYPPRRIECDNCVLNTIGGVSTNAYRHGGPAPFNFGKCPLCGGNGYHEEEITENINLRIYWEQRDWIKVSEIAFPSAEVQVIGFASDLQKLRRANEILVNRESTHGVWRMVLAGQPFMHGFGKDRYFIAFLKSV